MATTRASYTYSTADTNGEPSTFEIKLSESNGLGQAGTVFDAFCGDVDLPILGNRQGVYSGDYTDLKAAGLNNSGSINWLLNAYPQDLAGFPPNAMQAAIWTLLGQDWTRSEGFDGYTVANATQVYQLVGQALQHQSFVPAAGESLAIIIDPIVNGEHSQPFLIEVKAAQLGDRVWHDSDADGVQDAGEAGIAGAKVELLRDIDGDGQYNAAGEVTGTTTDANGNYTFKGLTPGVDYQVRFTTPDGFTGTSPRQADGNAASGTNSDGALTDTVVLKPGENNTTLDSGFYKNASLGDKVWNDTDRDGVQDANETGRAGVRVELYTCVDGKPGQLVGTQSTDADGNYKFTDLRPGEYVVKFIAPNGLMLTQQNVGDDALDSDAGADGLSACVTLSSGEHNPTIDAGLHANIGALGDRVWFDTNRNGIQDPGEAGKARVQLQLITVGADGIAGTGDDRVVATTTTDANGNYLFSNLNAGSYAVKVTGSGINATTEEITQANAGDDAADSDLTNLLANRISGYTDVVNLAQGEVNLTVDVGVTERLGALGDYVWLDVDKDGRQDTTERGIEGVQVTLAGAGADGVFGSGDDIAANTVTDANGKYLFSDLAAGKYQVTFGTPEGLEFTKANATTDTIDSDANLVTGQSQVVTLGRGQTNLTIDAGLVSKDQTNPDGEEVCENTSQTFNVLANDNPGLKLISVKHENATLDTAFKRAGGVLSFSEDGTVIYRSKTDGFGADKLVYVAEDANGQRYTQTVDIDIDGAKVAARMNGHKQWDTVLETGESVPAGTPDSYYGVWHTITLKSSSSLTAEDGPNKAVVYQIKINQLQAADTPSILRMPDGTLLTADENGDFWVRATAPSMTLWDFRQWGAGPDGKVYSHQSISTTAWIGEFDDSGTVLLDKKCASSTVTTASNTPLVLDLNGDGVQTLGVDEGVEFDILGTGVAQATGWVDGNDGLLALDRNGDGKINDGGELFGDSTTLANGATAFDGFQALADFDDNSDGRIDADDSVFSKLQLWVDANSNGQTDMGELVMLAQMGIASLNLAAETGTEVQNGNTLGLVSSYMDSQGQTHAMADVWFDGTTSAPPLTAMVGDDQSLDHLLGSEAAARADAPADLDAAAYADAGDVLRRAMASASEVAVA